MRFGDADSRYRRGTKLRIRGNVVPVLQMGNQFKNEMSGPSRGRWAGWKNGKKAGRPGSQALEEHDGWRGGSLEPGFGCTGGIACPMEGESRGLRTLISEMVEDEGWVQEESMAGRQGEREARGGRISGIGIRRRLDPQRGQRVRSMPVSF